MSDIIYNPEEAGKQVISKNGKLVLRRKYHMTEEEKTATRTSWLLDVRKVDKRIRKKSGRLFFNPYRKGIYYYQIQSLFLLGGNQWHSLSDVLKKIEAIMSAIPAKGPGFFNAWEKYKGKSERDHAVKCKDHIGRIQENFIFFQRLGERHPYAYKLMQVGAAIDMKRVSKRGISNGIFFYRLSTYSNTAKAFPIRNYKRFKFLKHRNKYVSNKFIGTIITSDDVIKQGI